MPADDDLGLFLASASSSLLRRATSSPSSTPNSVLESEDRVWARLSQSGSRDVDLNATWAFYTALLLDLRFASGVNVNQIRIRVYEGSKDISGINILRLVHRIHIRLADLSLMTAKSFEFSDSKSTKFAMSLYFKAMLLMPDVGIVYSKLAALAKSPLDIVYYLCLS